MRATQLRAGLGVVLGAALLTAAPASSAGSDPDGSGAPLARLRHDAGRVHVESSEGRVTALRGPSGERLVGAAAGATPREAAHEFIRKYGGALRSSGTAPEVTSPRVRPFLGGAVVAVRQEVAGLPVVAGEIRVVLDDGEGLRAMTGELTEVTRVPDATVTAADARRTARALVARGSQARVAVTDLGAWVYDPALVGEPTSTPPRRVWRFEVVGAGQAADVLVDARSGSVVLHASERHEVRRICDGANIRKSDQIASCTSGIAAREEGEPNTGMSDVDLAYAAIGRTEELFARSGVALTELIGTGSAGSRVIEAWVRYCNQSDSCPMPNAYWDGARIALGSGYASADDVVAHELTHGVIERTADLMYLHQSGAMNESLADVFGELLDQQVTADGDTSWLVGESSPGGPFRSMANPPLYGQPDRMRSPQYGTHDSSYDSGDVHTNSGIGNKAAWLISVGGSFNGQVVSGIDAGDPTRQRSLLLWRGVLELLTSGSEYADLANALETACDQLAAAGAGGMTAPHCQQVRNAVVATELRAVPSTVGAAAAEVSDVCAPGETRQVLFQDDDTHAAPWLRSGSGDNIDGLRVPLWTQNPKEFFLDEYAQEGSSSWFGADPDPQLYGDDPTALMTLAEGAAVRIPTGARTYLHFHHAYDLDQYQGSFYDGGRVHLLTQQSGSWQPTSTPVSWVNGPTKSLAPGAAGSGPAFAGDSRGMGSSRVELTNLAGQDVRPRFGLFADSSVAFQGWWVDSVEIYSCLTSSPSAVRSLAPHGSRTGVTLTWQPPSASGSGIASYRVTRSDGDVRNYPVGATSAVYTSLPSGATHSFSVVPVATNSELGPARSVSVVRSRLGFTTSATSVASGRSVTLLAKLTRADTGGGLGGRAVVFQRRAVGATTWATLGTRTTGSAGGASLTVAQTRGFDYRVRFSGAGMFVGKDSVVRRVTIR